MSIHLNEGSDRSAVSCDIRLFTATAQSIYSNAWMITYDEPTGVAKLWWYYGDYSGTALATIDRVGWSLPSAGTWQTTKPTGTQVWNVVVNGAEKLTTARTISLTGDVTGSASFDGSANTSIAATVANDSHSHSNSTITSLDASKVSSGTLAASRLPASGVTAGSYGPTANVTGTNNTTINVPQITVDAYGRVTRVTNRVYTSKDTNTTYSLSSFGITATAAELNKLDGVTTTATQFNYLNTLTGNVQTQLNGKASSSHTHNYAGSSSAGGAATSANKLNTNAGNASQPVYFSNGVPVAATAYSNAITQGLKVDDSRNDNPPPNSASFTKQALTVDFKYNHIVGSPTGFGGNYCGLLSLAPWSETSGGNGYQIAIGYNGNAHPRLAIRSADLSATSWGTWYKIYTSDDKPTPAEIGAATSGHTHSNYLTTSGTAAAATKLATARTINGTNFNGTANITTSYWGTARTITIGNTGKSVNGSGNVSWSLSEIGAAASSHTHSYLPLSGGTLTGRLTANAKISATTSGGRWIDGKTVTNAGYCITMQPDSAGNAYYPFFAAKSGSGHTVNLGCLGNAWGFYGFKSSRTDNGTDWQFTFDAGTGAITHNSTMTITGKNFNYKNTNCSTFTTSSSATAANGNSRVYFTNNNNQCMGEALTGVDSTNYSFMRMEAVRPNGSATYYNTLNLKLGPTGQYLYSVTSAAAFRNSLGLGNTSGALPVLNGGTGTTAKGKTLLSNIGITSGTGSAPSSGTNGCIYIQYS